MAPPITVYVGYTIFFTDPVEYAAAVTLCGGNGYGHCPFTAASTFGIPWPLPSGDMAQIPKGMWGAINFGIPDVPGPGKEIYFPAASGVFMKSDVDSVVVPGQAGTPATIWPAGPDGIHKWWGTIILLKQEITGTVPAQAPIPKRRWISAFEMPGSSRAELSFSGSGPGNTLDSSRTLGGRGITIRGANGYSPTVKDTYTYYGASVKKTSWERFYVRVNNLGAAEFDIWRCRSLTAGVGNAGAILKLTPAGQIKIYSNTNLNVQTALATSPTVLTLDRWYKVDILITWSTGGLGGQLRIYLNGVFDFTAADNTGNGLDNNDSHGESWLGQSGADAGWDIDLDDWICADVPNIAGVESLTSVDWVLGTHVRPVNMVSGTSVGWTGPTRTVQQWFDPYDNPGAGTYLSTSTPASLIEILTDQSDKIIEPGASIVGPVSMAVGAYTWDSAALGEFGQLGYRIAGGAPVLVNIGEGTGFIWGNAAYLPSVGLLPPTSLAPLYLQKVKGPNGAASNIVIAVGAIVEYVGVWGQEDDPNYFDLSNNVKYLLHNAPFANLQEAIILGGPIASSVFAVGGTYAGNSNEVTIDLPAPPHMIWIRPVGAGTEGTRWFSAGIGGSEGGNSNMTPTRMIRVWADDTGAGHFTVAGNEAEINVIGRTYQYIVFCDPGSRFCYNLAYCPRSAAASVVRNFFDPNWLPQAGWQQRTALNGAGGPQTQSYKGAGNAGTTGQTIQATAQANWGSWVAGQITLGANNIFATYGNVNISLWREFDDAGYNMVQIFSYVGDGNAFRTINFPHPSGRWPLWAAVIPQSGANQGYARDPSNAGNQSYGLGNLSLVNTAIVGGGVDLINVGSSLNVLGVVHEVFVILGDDDGWNNGTFGPPDGLATGDFQIPPYSPVVVGDGGLNFNGQPALLVVKNLSGIYTLVPGKTDDTFYTGNAANTVDVKKPDPTFKTGYIGG